MNKIKRTLCLLGATVAFIALVGCEAQIDYTGVEEFKPVAPPAEDVTSMWEEGVEEDLLYTGPAKVTRIDDLKYITIWARGNGFYTFYNKHDASFQLKSSVIVNVYSNGDIVINGKTYQQAEREEV